MKQSPSSRTELRGTAVSADAERPTGPAAGKSPIPPGATSDTTAEASAGPSPRTGTREDTAHERLLAVERRIVHWQWWGRRAAPRYPAYQLSSYMADNDLGSLSRPELAVLLEAEGVDPPPWIKVRWTRGAAMGEQRRKETEAASKGAPIGTTDVPTPPASEPSPMDTAAAPPAGASGEETFATQVKDALDAVGEKFGSMEQRLAALEDWVEQHVANALGGKTTAAAPPAVVEPPAVPTPPTESAEPATEASGGEGTTSTGSGPH